MPIDGGVPALLLSGRTDPRQLNTISGDYAIGSVEGRLYAAPLAGGPRLQLSPPAQKAWSEPLIITATR